MDFDWSDEQAELRERVRALLRRELPADWESISRHGPGSPEQTAFSLAFCPKLAAEGLLVPHWPAAHGGRDASAWEHFIVGEELFAAGEPRGPQYMNVNFIGATLMRFGTPAQRERYLPPMAAGRSIWCQGFSEPSAGSDLAALATQARRCGDDYVINGSKVWTSYAGLAQQCFLLARTAGTGKSGKDGIAIFLVPMDTPGITVRPIPSLIGHGDIHEVFFDDVVVRRRRGWARKARPGPSSAMRCRWSAWAWRVMPSRAACSTAWWHCCRPMAASTTPWCARVPASRWPPAKRRGCWSTVWSTSVRVACRPAPRPAWPAWRSWPPTMQ